MNYRSAFLFFALGLPGLACDSDDPPASPAADQRADPPAAPEAKASGSEVVAKPAPEGEPSTAAGSNDVAANREHRASTPSSVEAKTPRSLGARNKALAGMYALEGSVGTPSWGTAGGSADAVRDDDLRTAWSCTASEDKPCAMALSLPSTASVVAVRIYAAGGSRGPEVEPAKQTVSWPHYKAHPRPSKVRVHTRGGYVDAVLKDGADDRYIVFAEPLQTDVVTLEFTELHKGKKNEELLLAEFEVYGTEGAARAPLVLDPGRTYVRYETTPWSTSTVRQVFLEEASGDTRRRLMRATALYGSADARFVLVERMFKTTCDTTDGSYTLLDTKTRVPWALGKLGGVPAVVVAAEEGFVVLPPDGDPEGAKGVGLEDGVVKVRRNVDAPLEPVLTRGLGQDTPKSCTAPKDLAATGLTERYPELAPREVLACSLGGATAYLTRFEGCDKRWSVVVAGEDGTVVAELHNEDEDGRGLRSAVLDDGTFLVETTAKGGDVTQLHAVTAEGITLFADRASFATRPPASCRACSDAFLDADAEPGAGPEAGAAAELPSVTNDERSE